MTDDKKKKSADEIVDETAAEMGVDKESVPASDESSEDVMAGLGGIFDVPVKKKKKKKVEEAVVEDDASEASEGADEDDEPEAKPASKAPAKSKAPEAKPKKPKKEIAGLDIFQGGEDVDLNDPSYLGSEDLGNYDAPQKSNLPVVAGVVVVVIVVAVAAVFSVGSVDDLGALFRGELKERRYAEKNRIEAEYEKEQLESLELFGTLFISGNVKYADIKLNGQKHFGETSSGHFRDLQLVVGTVIQNLKVKEKQVVEVTAPGYQPFVQEITRGMWNENPGGDFTFNLTANLAPLTVESKAEFDMRNVADVDTNYFGTITITTQPPGAAVVFNNHPLVDAKGNELRTPVTFSEYYAKDENGKLEERKVHVDTIIDIGHKVEIFVPDSEYPKYLTALQRQMWTCNWKAEADLKRIGYNADKDSIQKKCDYTWNFHFDFDNLKKYIADRDAELKRIEEQNAAERKKMEEQAEQANR